MPEQSRAPRKRRRNKANLSGEQAGTKRVRGRRCRNKAELHGERRRNKATSRGRAAGTKLTLGELPEQSEFKEGDAGTKQSSENSVDPRFSVKNVSIC